MAYSKELFNNIYIIEGKYNSKYSKLMYNCV